MVHLDSSNLEDGAPVYSIHYTEVIWKMVHLERSNLEDGSPRQEQSGKWVTYKGVM